MLPLCDKGAVPPGCQSLLSSDMPEILGITIQVGCHSTNGMLTGHAPARTHPSPSKNLFLHHLHFKIWSKQQQKSDIQSHCNVKRLFPLTYNTCTPIRDLPAGDMIFKW